MKRLRRGRWLLGLVTAGGCLLGGWAGLARAAEAPNAAAVFQELQSFRTMGTVLMVAAHPDDENTQLIAYLARGRNYRMAYLSVTRGDGGQNLLGPEFGEELGLARTQELLAARRLDGGRQFFTRAMDFGFSKDFQDALNIWGEKEVLGDVVRVIRTFRPDVVVNRFSTQPGGTHGHHTASAVLSVQAFKLAGDPTAYPEQLTQGLTVWQPKRLFVNGGVGGRGGAGAGGSSIQIDVSGTDAVSGLPYTTLAGNSRAMHKTQGFGNFGGGGRGGGGGARTESFTLLDGEPASKDIMDGIDTTWARVSGGEEVGKAADALIASFNKDDLSANVPALLSIKAKAAGIAADPIVDEKRRQLDHILQECLGLEILTVVDKGPAVPGESLKFTHTITLHSNYPVEWLGIQYPSLKSQMGSRIIKLVKDQAAVRESTHTLPLDTPVTQPYWLREEPLAGRYQVADASQIGQPENGPAIPLEQEFRVDGQWLRLPDEAVETVKSADGPTTRRLDIIAPVSLHFVSEVRLFAPGATRPVEVEITSHRPNMKGTVLLGTPVGWEVSPAAQPFEVAAAGGHTRVSFNVKAPSQIGVGTMTVQAQIGEAKYSYDWKELNYAHIPPQLLQPAARERLVCLEMATHGKQIGYVPGAGDSVAEALEEMGYKVTQLTGADLTADKLKNLDAVVFGVRAFDVRKDLAGGKEALSAFVENGGNVIVQYNRQTSPQGTAFPYNLGLSGDRVTDEKSAVTFLAPDHAAMNTPNKITQADFDGWVQERGIYFPNQWDEHFVPLLAWNDKGEQPLKGSLLVAPYGKGHFVYTSIVWFRELPAGVPGAYRLFANLVSLGK